MPLIHQYLDALTCSKGWEIISPTEFQVQTVVWKGHQWSHTLTLDQPGTPKVADTAILLITGDRVDPADAELSAKVSKESSLPVFSLFNIPNQPIWDMREDDLIAHTFEQFLDSKDSSWPLLFPMTQAVISAMDQIQEHFPHLQKFVLTGGSKRGWTTWLAGATADPRIIGICPQVFDNLNMATQMKRQVEIWGQLSPKLDDYARRQFEQILDHPDGLALTNLVDPIAVASDIQCRIHIINGGNDEYWLVDALSSYIQSLPGKPTAFVAPNLGHDLQHSEEVQRSLAEFALACALDKPFGDWGSFIGESTWYATSDDYQFSNATWTTELPNASKYIASFQIRDHYGIFGQYSVSSPVEVKILTSDSVDSLLQTKSTPKARTKKVPSTTGKAQ